MLGELLSRARVERNEASQLRARHPAGDSFMYDQGPWLLTSIAENRKLGTRYLTFETDAREVNNKRQRHYVV